MSEITCNRIIEVTDGSCFPDGKQRYWHVRCGAPAQEIELKGELTTCTEILCARHRAAAINEIKKQQERKKPKPPDERQLKLENSGMTG